MDPRVVEVNIVEEMFDECCDGGPCQLDMQQAVGRMVMFGQHYDKVIITNDGRNDLIAAYFNNDDRRFVLGAVWRVAESKYEFHS